ncbi:hypothetical protein B0A55_12892 [Friedmanniomyces simplex]|uniref:3'-5' exonuclease domain-containing protein n=1 Tax=Friedmanniomyces simplex TaxID=329884 RepID=A0A4U0W1V5_9PEZI|nr:hypothetical protein B0A55_12501 [Friedmanniomyces simplex]TKA62249.1 hypothetical protein B0A55_12892 [Friedmanniomyces simplex]
MDPMFLDTTAALKKFLRDLGNCDGQPPRLYVDLEGNKLSRNGTLSLVTILLEPESEIYLVDVTTLGRDAFTTAGADGRTLKAVLESKDIVKVFFDIRNDSDALFGLHEIRVAGIEDLQLMELASRNFSKRHINGLAKCIERDSALPFVEKREWKVNKERGRKLFDPALGGGYAVFDERPLSSEMERYCVQDVIYMPALRELYRAKLCDAWWKKIEKETVARIELSQGKYFNGQGMHMAKSPKGWEHWKPKAFPPLEDLLRLGFYILQTYVFRHVRELVEIYSAFVTLLVFDRWKKEFYLVKVLHKPAFQCLTVLSTLPDSHDALVTLSKTDRVGWGVWDASTSCAHKMPSEDSDLHSNSGAFPVRRSQRTIG